MIIKKILKRYIKLISHIISGLNYVSNFVWFNYPFGNKPLASEKRYLELFEEEKKKRYPEIENYERQKGIAIDKEWIDNLALYTQVTIKKSNLCYVHGRVLYTVLSDYLSKKSKETNKEKITILETGTARGFSSICMAKALDDHKIDGLIVTFDLLPHSEKMFWNSISDNTNGALTRAQLLKNWKNLCQKYILFHQGDTRLELKKIYFERIHFAFLDGAHSYNDVMFEFNQIKKKQNQGDIIVYDDYNFKKFPGIVKAVDEICKKNNYAKQIIKSSSQRGYVIAIKQ